MRLEEAGRPTVLVATTAFERLARTVAARYEMPDARIAVVAHPLGGISSTEVLDRAGAVVDEVMGLWTQET